MRKTCLFLTLLTLLMLSVPAFAADQWDKDSPAGTTQVADIDTNIGIQNEALDRLLIGYRRGLGINYSTAAAVNVLAGELAIPNSGETIVRLRRTTSTTSVGWADIDTGAEASATTYYIYATADTDITGMVFKISASSSAPSGATYYRQIGSFYNNSSSSIENVVSYRPENGVDYRDVVKGWGIITVSGTAAILDQYNISGIVDDGTGQITVTWDTDFAGTSYPAVCTNGSTTTSAGGFCYIVSRAAGSCRIEMVSEAGAVFDPPSVSIIAGGDRT